MRRAIERAGCFVIRDLFDAAGVARVRVRAELASQAWDFMVARGYVKGHEDFVAGAFAAGHIPGEDIDVAQTISDIIENSSYDVIATELFGNASHGYAVRRSTLNGKANPLGYHQDGFFTNPGYNFWTPLVDSGVTAPSVEVVVGSGGPILSHDVIRHDVAAHITEHYGQGYLWHPEIRAGDVLVFTTFMMHRTYCTPDMSQVRHSLEIRGSIARQIKIAGVLEEHWSMSPLQSMEEWNAYRAQAAGASSSRAAVTTTV
jgi:hypothetical protein